MAIPYAFVTLLTSDSYLDGALTLAAALRDVHPSPAAPPEVDFQTVCLVTPETVDVSTTKLLRRSFDIVIGVEVIAQKDDKNLQLLGRPDLNTVLTKLHVFRLTQYSKIIFLDADVLPIRPLSHLFTLPHEFSAVPDVGWPDIFNSGVLVLSPGDDKFEQLNALLDTKGTWDGGDQGILNEWRGNDWNKLSFTYNTTPTAAYTYAPAYERYGSQISAIHFIGPNKPWHSVPFRAPFQQEAPAQTISNQQAYDYTSLLDRWFAVYDRHYRSEAIPSTENFEVRRYTSVWDTQSQHIPTSAGSASSVGGGHPLGLDELKQLAIHGLSGSGFNSSSQGEGEYKSLPLEGRFDLMHRPQLQREGSDTPQQHAISLPPEQSAPPLPTPGPHEVPPSPVLQPVPLPTVLTPIAQAPAIQHLHHPFRSKSQSQSQSQALHQHEHKEESQHEHQHQHHQHHDHASNEHHENHHSIEHHEHHRPNEHQGHHRNHQRQYLQPEHQIHREPPRPASPPKMLWNPSLEPPPNIQPPASAFPADTYFPNIWDQPSNQNHDMHHQHPSAPASTSSDSLFKPPPTPDIPASLIMQGHYRRVTGDDSTSGASPSPDRAKVKSVFPWEEKPRHMPTRKFPDSEEPSPSLFTRPESPPTSSSEVTSPVPQPPQPRKVSSPTYGLPNQLAYANAWDNVPSIQQYAARLVRPAPQPTPLAPAFGEKNFRKSWDDKSEGDGDDEDDGDEERNQEDSDREGSRSGNSVKARTRRDSESVSATYTIKGKKKEYRVRGVQTVAREMRSMGVQVNTDATVVSQPPASPTLSQHQELTKGQNRTRTSSTSSFTRGSGRKQWIPSGGSLAPISVNGNAELPMTTAVPSPSARHSGTAPSTPPGLKSPREYTFPEAPGTIKPTHITTPPPMRARSMSEDSSPGVMRQHSNDGSPLASPPSSVGPVSPPEGQPLISPPSRKGGRVWDPARGVELFKRGSEEVLARFLKMSSWEEENGQHA